MPKLKRKEISHILGLKDNPFDTAFENEGWYVEDAQESIQNRYKNLTNGRQVAFDRIKIKSLSPSFWEQSLSINPFAKKIKALPL